MIRDIILNSIRVFGDRLAVEVEGRTLSYSELGFHAAGIAEALNTVAKNSNPKLTAVFAYRSVTAFTGVVAALLRGHGYVPLNRTFPVDRTRLMLERSGCEAVIVDSESEKQMEALLTGLGSRHVFLLPHRMSLSDLASKWPMHQFLGAADIKSSSATPGGNNDPNAIAYLLFTSGSTGQPKGVAVSNANVEHYLNFVTDRYQVSPDDRLSQNFDMTFDLSAHDMFVAWANGACLCCPSLKTLMKPGKFINESRLTLWFSVPSTGVFMRRFGELKPASYPNLRLSLFCGEALPVDVVKSWRDAAPNSVVENIYGPTELTIACTAYRWCDTKSPGECEFGVVPIGSPFTGMEALVVNDELKEVPPGTDGELLMCGPQLSLGYWADPDRTAKSFISVTGRSEVFYRTGDRVRRPSVGQPMTYLGRMDSQMKILGHRVELGEIEAVIREESGIDGVVAVGWPQSASGADGIEVFLETENLETVALLERVKNRLPSYMTPRRIHVMRRFPLNANGKFDRKALEKMLD